MAIDANPVFQIQNNVYNVLIEGLCPQDVYVRMDTMIRDCLNVRNAIQNVRHAQGASLITVYHVGINFNSTFITSVFVLRILS